MKHGLIFLACCLLFLGAFNAAAQEQTYPLPPPEDGTSTLPAPGGDAPAASAPARDNSSGSRRSGSGSSGSAGRSTARAPAREAPSRSVPARSAPVQPAAASAQEGIPDKGRFWGFRIGGSYDWYSMKEGLKIDSHGRDAEGGGFNAGLLFGHDFGLLVLQGELLINTGWNGYHYNDNSGGSYKEEHLDFDITTFQIPVMVKLDLHWGRIMFQPQLGFYLNFGLGEMTYNYDYWRAGSGQSRHIEKGSSDYSSPLFGFMAGGALGVRIGRGYFFLDIRYAGDLDNIKIKAEDIEIKRHAVMTALGYQYYFRSSQ